VPFAAPSGCTDCEAGRIGQPFLTDSLDGLALHVAQSRAGLLPARPTISVQVPTAVDPSRAPAGGAVMRVQVTDVPTWVRGDAAGEIDSGDGRWTADLTDRFVDRVLEAVDRHVPGLSTTILGHSVVTPATLAGYNPNAGPGDPYGGAQDLAQRFFFRPLPASPATAPPCPTSTRSAPARGRVLG
jgi:phytoene dehydrogenase-like protein